MKLTARTYWFWFFVLIHSGTGTSVEDDGKDPTKIDITVSTTSSSIPPLKSSGVTSDVTTGNPVTFLDLATNTHLDDAQTDTETSEEENSSTSQQAVTTSTPATLQSTTANVASNSSQTSTILSYEPMPVRKPQNTSDSSSSREEAIKLEGTTLVEVKKHSSVQVEETTRKAMATIVENSHAAIHTSTGLPPELSSASIPETISDSVDEPKLSRHSDHQHTEVGRTAFLEPTESAAILAGVFVGVAILGYAGLVIWRKILDDEEVIFTIQGRIKRKSGCNFEKLKRKLGKRYGNREMLVNEEDFYDTSDLKYFEL